VEIGGTSRAFDSTGIAHCGTSIQFMLDPV
jgi:hypothetical protein